MNCWRQAPLAVVAIALAIGASGCTRSKPLTAPEPPPLVVPPPPPRVIPPPVTEPIDRAGAPAGESGAATTARPRPTRARGDAAARTEPRKPDATTPPAGETAATAPPPPAALQTAPAATQGEMERRTKEYMKQAGRDLETVRPARLDRDAREQYETAQRFLRQAQQALNDRNLVFALTLAEKAATISADLAHKAP